MARLEATGTTTEPVATDRQLGAALLPAVRAGARECIYRDPSSWEPANLRRRQSWAAGVRLVSRASEGVAVLENLLLVVLLVAVLPVLLYANLTTSGRRWSGRDKVAARKQARQVQRRTERRSAPGARCPTCSSTSIVRVTAGTRVASGVAGGLLFSRNARAQFQCGSCGYYW